MLILTFHYIYNREAVKATIDISLDVENYGGSQTFTFSSTTQPTITGENGFTFNSEINSTITVIDTPPTQFTFTPIETETFGESNVGIQNTDENLAGEISRSIRFGQTSTDITGSGLEDSITGSSVSRFRTLVTITEPLGPLHHSSSIRMRFSHTDGNIDDIINNINGPYQAFSTNSLNIFNSSSTYDLQKRLVTLYTSSFTNKSRASASLIGFSGLVVLYISILLIISSNVLEPADLRLET